MWQERSRELVRCCPGPKGLGAALWLNFAAVSWARERGPQKRKNPRETRQFRKFAGV